MKFGLKNPRVVWISLFLVINVVGAYIIFDSNVLLGESGELPLYDRSSVLPALLIVLTTYIGIQVFVLPFFLRLKITGLRSLQSRPNRIAGLTLFTLQTLFIIFFTVTGTFVAGSSERSGSPISALWVIINVDALFFIYYGFYRDSRLFWPNLIISIISNVLRGWTGVFMIVAFMESARLMRSGKMNIRLIALAILLMVICFPVIQFTKLQIRFMSSGLSQEFSLVEIAINAIENIQVSDYLELMTDSGQQIITRIHLVSSTIAVNQELDFFVQGIEAARIEPFWKEGIYGITFDRLTGQPSVPNLGVALAMAITGEHEVHWNSNPGYLAWILIEPLYAPMYLLYTFGLLFIWVCIIKKLNGGTQAKDMLWLASLLYFPPGWIASCVLFTHSLLLFLLFHRFFGGRKISNGEVDRCQLRIIHDHGKLL